MRLVTLIASALCTSTCVLGEVPQNTGDSVETDFGPEELHYRMRSTSDNGVDDQQLSEKQLSGQDVDRSVIAGVVENILEGFRDTIINGNENLPPLDPLEIDEIGPIQYKTTGVRISAQVNDFKAEGLRWYLVDRVTFNALRLALEVKVTVPWIIVTGDYSAHARITLLQHNAGGAFRVFVNRLETSVDSRMGVSIFGGKLFLRELDIKIVIHDINIQIHGMVGSSVLNNLINSLVQNAAENLLRDQLETVSETLSKELFDIINDFLADFTLDDILG